MGLISEAGEGIVIISSKIHTNIMQSMMVTMAIIVNFEVKMILRICKHMNAVTVHCVDIIYWASHYITKHYPMM